MNFVFYVIFRLVIHLFSSIHLIFFWEPGNILTNVPRLYRILFIILICLCIHYADRCCINLDNWNIFQQHNWHNYAWFFCFHDDNESEAVEAHIPRHRDSKTKKPRHRDSKTKKPRHRVPVEFWSLCPLIQNTYPDLKKR